MVVIAHDGEATNVDGEYSGQYPKALDQPAASVIEVSAGEVIRGVVIARLCGRVRSRPMGDRLVGVSAEGARAGRVSTTVCGCPGSLIAKREQRRLEFVLRLPSVFHLIKVN